MVDHAKVSVKRAFLLKTRARTKCSRMSFKSMRLGASTANATCLFFSAFTDFSELVGYLKHLGKSTKPRPELHRGIERSRLSLAPARMYTKACIPNRWLTPLAQAEQYIESKFRPKKLWSAPYRRWKKGKFSLEVYFRKTVDLPTSYRLKVDIS